MDTSNSDVSPYTEGASYKSFETTDGTATCGGGVQPPMNGTDNTGGGGASASENTPSPTGGSGGSGVVIIRYKFQ